MKTLALASVAAVSLAGVGVALNSTLNTPAKAPASPVARPMALSAPKNASAPPKMAYVVRYQVLAVVAGGDNAQARLDAATAAVDTAPAAFCLQSESYTTAGTAPAGIVPPPMDDLLSIWDTGLTTPSFNLVQTGYTREVAGCLRTVGDPAKALGVVYETRTTYFPVPSLDRAKGMVASIYSMRRALNFSELAEVEAHMDVTGTTDLTDPRGTLVQAQYNAMLSTQLELPPKLQATMPTWGKLAPRDMAYVTPPDFPAGSNPPQPGFGVRP